MAVTDSAISSAEFDALLNLFGPFEEKPHLAVAVSGGADSLALTILADAWARARQGRITALTVDHRLRKASTSEAAQLGKWLAKRKIEHKILLREGPKPRGNLQAAAREARYALLLDWCRGNGVIHLLLAHHLDDQAETVLMREERNAGPPGQASMAGVTERAAARLIRPLLPVPKFRLTAMLDGLGQKWIEDPTNEDVTRDRVRVRKSLADNPDRDERIAELVSDSSVSGVNRRAADTRIAALLARSVGLERLGYARVHLERFMRADTNDGIQALGMILRTVAGEAYPPTRNKVEAFYESLAESGIDKVRTLGGCRLAPADGGILVVSRETGRLKDEIRMEPGSVAIWDGRFQITLGRSAPRAVRVRPMQRTDWTRVRREQIASGQKPPPDFAGAALPGLFDRGNLIAVPPLGWAVPESIERGFRTWSRYAPAIPLTQAPFSPHPSLPR